MRLADVVATSQAVAATSSRSAKVAAIAGLLAGAAPEDARSVVCALSGAPRQGRIGVGWRTLAATQPPPADEPTLTVADLDATLDAVAALTGPGSTAARSHRLSELLGRATRAEQAFLTQLLTGGIRQGALEGVVTDAVAKANGVPLAVVRRAAMLAGDLGVVAAAAAEGGEAALAAFVLSVGRPVLPMLAASSEDVASAVGCFERSSVEWKLDGARVQAHLDGDSVGLFTRNLNDVTARLPGIAEVVRSLPVRSVVLDGEVVGLGDAERPDAFQETMSRFGRDDGAGGSLVVRFFDCIHADGRDLLDTPLEHRLDVLAAVAGPYRVPGIRTTDPAEAAAFAERALAAGHEGVMVKDLSSPYEAGRRGSSWRKVKPVRTLDLVVLAAEWGHGRRQAWLSNLHLGARDCDAFVMVGKTFKGLTDDLLRWQTAAFLERAIDRDGIVVHVRPELVVEIAVDGAQRSTRYAGGVALRFARVKRYRPDKSPQDADGIDAVRALLHGAATDA